MGSKTELLRHELDKSRGSHHFPLCLLNREVYYFQMKYLEMNLFFIPNLAAQSLDKNLLIKAKFNNLNYFSSKNFILSHFWWTTESWAINYFKAFTFFLEHNGSNLYFMRPFHSSNSSFIVRSANKKMFLRISAQESLSQRPFWQIWMHGMKNNMDIGKKPFYVTKFDWVRVGVSRRRLWEKKKRVRWLNYVS